MTGSAIRKPRIQPGYGSECADSMMAGRTTLMGTSPALSATAISPSALVKAYASGKPREVARATPASAILSSTHRQRSCSVLAARLGMPAAPNSPCASLRKPFRFPGVRLSVSVSRRIRRAASTSPRQSTSTKNELASTGSSGALPRLLPAT